MAREISGEGTRLRWAREIQESDVSVWAEVMQVSPEQWLRWEDGIDDLPFAVVCEAVRRLSITLNYVAFGELDSFPGTGALAEELARLHPELRTASRWDMVPRAHRAH